MILSVSRRTDIPSFYSDWFFNRISDGYLYVRNPMNIHQISKIDISPRVVDCIVFWTKNPKPMLGKLDVLDNYNYYFQFTLTGYGKDIESNIPDKRSELITTFQELSRKIGKDRMIWRYDPILINNKYTVEYHLKAFEEICQRLEGYTQKVIISFMDMYTKIKKNMSALEVKTLDGAEMKFIATHLVSIANKYSFSIESCAENIDLEHLGISHGSCIDKNLLEKIIGYRLKGNKDKNQRQECGCFESIDIGAYNTCKNGCVYCYANESTNLVYKNYALYDSKSPILCSEISEKDIITERKVASLKIGQISIFDDI